MGTSVTILIITGCCLPRRACAIDDTLMPDLTTVTGQLHNAAVFLSIPKPTHIAEYNRAICRLKIWREDAVRVKAAKLHLFHYSMGRAARSKLLANYQHQLLEQLFLKMRLYFEVSEKVEDVVALHRMTLAALRTRRPGTIERAIDEHLQPLERQVAAAGDGAKRLRGRARAVASEAAALG